VSLAFELPEPAPEVLRLVSLPQRAGAAGGQPSGQRVLGKWECNGRADCCQGGIADLWPVRGHTISDALSSLKGYGKKSFVMVCRVLLVAANCSCSSHFKVNLERRENLH